MAHVGTIRPALQYVLDKLIPGGTLTELLVPLIREYYKKYQCLGVGSSRVTFDIGHGLVAKIPLHENYYNESEARKANAADAKERRLAEAVCVVENGIVILLMEKVTPVETEEEVPPELRDWHNHFDCGQVGWNSKGELVAYDFA